MNYRDYKIFAKDNYYHVFNRGVGKIDIFRDEADRRFFLYRLKENLFPELKAPFRGQSPEGRLQGKSHTPYVRKTLPALAYSLLCYCLMPNHFHFLIRQNSDLAISKLLLKVCTSYSKYFNQKYERVGTLFQDRFKAVLVDNDSYLLWLSAYIHKNPIAAGLVKDLKNYCYCSYLDYIGLRKGTLVDKKLILGMLNNNPSHYSEFVLQNFDNIKEQQGLQFLLLDE